ncbi:Adenosylcobinamide-phosphate synthase [Serinicoccus hydrothermalis]|uniref:Cobalamin biosynthesis protein CobD n=1 Tax=Serinicoccus hydrothermalis TaxID=1758689 RepID=A0A1B1NDN9_9MICO|nr:CobD/CbiB family cobalamin biosynthesis protein [Serinicoccus hydrothermalis]ANS79534.1 Adenosylcobinamide-phosphate synthase [Serinicoccus hydrothermalis]
MARGIRSRQERRPTPQARRRRATKRPVLAYRALGVAAGLLLDRALGEPPDAWHPVAWFGTAMGRVEGLTYADRRSAGAGYAVVGAGLGALAGASLARLGPAGLAAAVGVASAGRMLRHTSRDIEALLLAGDLDGARERLPWLVGRDPSGLDESGVAAAVVESLAENTVDAVIAPAFWGLVAGAPGVLVHRAVNTMDAMVGHRSPRYARFGTVAARADDILAWVPARLFAGLVALDTACARLLEQSGGYFLRSGPGRVFRSGEGPGTVFRSEGGTGEEAARPRDVTGLGVLATVRRDAPAHPSPNAGVAESAVAGALGVELGGPLEYAGRREERPRLGSGPRPGPTDIARARRLVDRVELAVVAACLAVAALATLRRLRSDARAA